MQNEKDNEDYLKYIIASGQSQGFIEEHNLDNVPEWYQYKRMKEKHLKELTGEDFWENLDGYMPLQQLITKLLVHAMDEIEKAIR